MSRQEWLANRRKGIGASDSPAIMGVSPYKTILEVYEDKITSEAPAEKTSMIMDKGNRYEPIIRQQFAAHYNLLNGTNETFAQALVKVAEFPFMMASLDGISKDGKTIVEIKFQGKEGHEAVKKGIVRIDYWTQIQHQIICSKSEKAYLASGLENDTKDGIKDVVWCEVSSDAEYQKKHFRAMVDFWDCVQNKTPPNPGGDDILPLVGMDDKVKLWKKLKLKIETEEEELESLRKEILAKVTHPRMYACGVTITEVEKSGSVDYKKIPELKGVDLEKYRKASSKYYKMDIK